MTDTPKKTGPSIARGQSKQSYGTPPELKEAVEARFGKIIFDLAADGDNTLHDLYFSEEDNAFDYDWHKIGIDDGSKDTGWLWLNPTYNNIGEWAEKCADEVHKGARILFHVPASTGAGWYWDHVKPHSHVLHLRQRVTYIGATDAYPKDSIIGVYAWGLTGESPWSWLTKEASKAVKERTTKLKADIAAGRV